MNTKFNLEDYKGNYVMHCKTEEEAKDFCRVLHEAGRRWFAGDYYLENNCFDKYKSETGYNFNNGTYANVDYYKYRNYIVLEWSDFMDHVFTKDDLKTGDVVLRRDGSVGIFIKDPNLIIFKSRLNTYLDPCYYDYHLLSKTYSHYDIMKVIRPMAVSDICYDAFEKKLGKLVYERDETVEMTIEEVCKTLGKNVKIVKEH